MAFFIPWLTSHLSFATLKSYTWENSNGCLVNSDSLYEVRINMGGKRGAVMMELPEEKICARGEVCNLPERVFREITMFAKKHSIQKVILFGSRSRGTRREAI